MTALLTIPETATELRVSPMTVRRLIKSGELETTDVGATGKSPQTRVIGESINALIERRKNKILAAR